MNGIKTDILTFTHTEMLEEIDTIIEDLNELDGEDIVWHMKFKDLINGWYDRKCRYNDNNNIIEQ